MIDPSAVVTLVRGYLDARARAPRGALRATAGAALLQVLADGLANREPLRALEDGADRGVPDAAAEERLRRAVGHLLATDPQLAGVVDDLAGHARREQQPEQVSAGGTSSNTTAQQLTLDRVSAGRDVHTTVTNRSRNTKIAIGGGGVVLAATALLIWHQYSSTSSAQRTEHDYRQQVLATCRHIQQDGTGSLPAVPDGDGIGYRRREAVAQLVTNARVVHDEVGRLLAVPAPAELAARRATVRTAAAGVERASVTAEHVLPRVLPKVFTATQLRDSESDPAVASLTDVYRHFGDAMSDLAGTDCPVRATS